MPRRREILVSSTVGHALATYLPIEDNVALLVDTIEMANAEKKLNNAGYNPASKALDLSKNPALKDLRVLRHLPILELNVSDTRVQSIEFLPVEHLQKLVISRGQLTRPQLENLRKLSVEVVQQERTMRLP